MLICLEAGGRSMISDGGPTELGCSLGLFVCARFHVYVCLFVRVCVFVFVCLYYVFGKPRDR